MAGPETPTNGLGRSVEPSFNPIPYAIAIAILILAYALTHMARDCSGNWTVRAGPQGIQGSCEAKELPKSSPVLSIPAAQQAPDRPLPNGYVYYEVSDGRPTDFGALVRYVNHDAPPFGSLIAGELLQATQVKQIRSKPTTLSGDLNRLPPDSCFRIAPGVRVTNQQLSGGSSGGWLPVESVPCGASEAVPGVR